MRGAGAGRTVPSDAMDLMAAASAEFERVVRAVPRRAWGRTTPCDLSVREVVGHVVAGNVFAVRLLAGATAADAVSGLDGDLLGGDPIDAVAGSCAEQCAAFDSVPRGRTLHHPSGDISVATFTRFRLGELVVHGWDVAVGAGVDPALDPAVADGLWALVAPHLDEMRAMGTFGAGAGADLPADASTQTRLLDAFGRRS
jgi:uncharacterized protein (TIGR03086 family)